MGEILYATDHPWIAFDDTPIGKCKRKVGEASVEEIDKILAA